MNLVKYYELDVFSPVDLESFKSASKCRVAAMQHVADVMVREDVDDEDQTILYSEIETAAIGYGHVDVLKRLYRLCGYTYLESSAMDTAMSAGNDAALIYFRSLE